jgi:site-specific DNA recombinase
LQHGEPAKIKIVRELFARFAAGESLNALAGDLNDRKVPGPDGGAWFVKSVKRLLQRRAYRGDFEYGLTRGGQFTSHDDKGNVADKAKLKGIKGKVIVKEGVYAPIIEAALFEKVQKRLNVLAKDRSRRKNTGYALCGGILVCDHCGGNLAGVTQHGAGSAIVYRCCGQSKIGTAGCPQYQIREDQILPFILNKLGEEIADLKTLLSEPPKALVQPLQTERNEQRESLHRERERLARQISIAEENLLFCEDARSRKSMDLRLSAKRDELEAIDAQLTKCGETDAGFSYADLAAR